MPSSGHGIAIAITSSQKLQLPALCMRKTGPVQKKNQGKELETGGGVDRHGKQIRDDGGE